MSGSRTKLVAVVGGLVLVAVGARAAAPAPAAGAGRAARLVAAGADGGGYPGNNGQEHVGAPCPPEATAIAGGTIVVVGGQEAAAGGGTGIGCDTFYAYEFRSGPPSTGRPSVEPAVFLNPGAPARPDSSRPDSARPDSARL